VSWGHPSTTGYPTIDYFLTSEAMEPPDGADHYTERLVRLPNLSIYYEPAIVDPAPIERPEFGLRPDACMFWCGQSISKYLPRHDEVFPLIAKEAPHNQFLLIDFGALGRTSSERFQRRLQRAFAAHGLDSSKHCAFCGRLNSARFSALLHFSDVYLDSIGWSGVNTTLEGLQHDLPIITIAAPLMRGRHTLGILREMGV